MPATHKPCTAVRENIRAHSERRLLSFSQRFSLGGLPWFSEAIAKRHLTSLEAPWVHLTCFALLPRLGLLLRVLGRQRLELGQAGGTPLLTHLQVARLAVQGRKNPAALPQPQPCIIHGILVPRGAFPILVIHHVVEPVVVVGGGA